MSTRSNHNHSHPHQQGENHHHDHQNCNHQDQLFHQHGPTNNKKALIIALSITSTIMILEFVGGLVTGSLALLSDSGHMLSDAFSLVLSLIAITFATKVATSKRTYGSQRYEVLAALLNAVTLFVIAAFIIVEAIERIQEPNAVASGTMIAIACIGLLANILSLYFMSRKGDIENSINLKSAYLHVMGDALGSVGAILAGIIMMITDWFYADPIISVIVALIILRSAWQVLKQTIHILMEGTPAHISFDKVSQLLFELDGVIEISQLRIWTITSNQHALTVHLSIDNKSVQQTVLQSAITQLNEHFKLDYITIQINQKNE